MVGAGCGVIMLILLSAKDTDHHVSYLGTAVESKDITVNSDTFYHVDGEKENH